TRASLLMWHSMLINELLPTLLRPMNAYSGSVGFGQSAGFLPLPRCSARSDRMLRGGGAQLLRQPLLQDRVELLRMFHHRRMAAFVDPMQFTVRQQRVEFLCDMRWRNGVLFPP